MPAPLPDLTRDQQCHFYMAPTGQRCGSPALKGDYYCYHHHLKNAKRTQHRVLIDPEVTRMELPPIEDRASIFVALAAVVHRLAENTIDTRRAGQMIYALQVALQSLAPAQPQHTVQAQHSPHAAAQSHSTANAEPDATIQPATQPDDAPSAAPSTFSIRKQDLLYFLRSRHCATCNAELFPASELTERSHPGAPPEIIEEARPALAAPDPTPDTPPEHLAADTSGPDEPETVLTLQAVAEENEGLAAREGKTNTGVLRCAQNDGGRVRKVRTAVVAEASSRSHSTRPAASLRAGSSTAVAARPSLRMTAFES